jgi:hypothetical protein
MPLTRRTAVVLALMFWQGGLLFYGAVVVPIGAGVLGSDLGQGFVTREVARAINLAGAAALPVLAWDVAASGGRRWRVALWAVLAGTTAYLFWQHARMAALLDPSDQSILDVRRFRHYHRWYLRVVTLQLFAGWAFVALTLLAWRRDDRAVHPGPAWTGQAGGGMMPG